MLAFWTGAAGAAPGDLDPSFGVGGVVDTPQAILQGHFRESAAGMAIGPKDEIFVLGTVPAACASGKCPVDLEVTRYNRNGRRDASYGVGGRAFLTGFSAEARQTASIAATSDGKVVVAATVAGDLVVVRLTPAGALDPTFGGGVVRTDLGGLDAAAAVAVQPDGAVVVAATRETPLEGFQSLLVRYTSGGVLDPTFGEGGIRVLGFAPGNYPAGLALPGQGRVAVGLSDCCYATGRALVARFTGSGVLDGAFARIGWRSVGRLAPASVEAIMPARRGRLIIVGTYNRKTFLARFLVDGRSDQRFGKRGLVWLDATRNDSWAGSAVDGVGRTLLAVTNGEFALMRLRSDGSVDRTFGGGRARAFAEIVGSETVALQSTGRIVVLGEAGRCDRTCARSRMVLVRYFGGDSGARCAGRHATVVGTRNRDILRGTPRRDVIQALGGNDRVLGLLGNDLICGAQGDDVLIGGGGRDRFVGGPGKDSQSQ